MKEKEKIKELREEFEELFKEASSVKYEVKFSNLSYEDAVDIVEGYAHKIDDFIHLIINIYPGKWDEYKRWFEANYDSDKAQRSSMMFKDQEFSGLNDQGDKVKKYFNYLVDYLVVVNHFIMSIEFKNIYEECSVVK